MEDIILKLHQIGALKFGSFEIKKDFLAPFQFHFSEIISHPELAKKLSAALWEKIKHLSYDLLAGASPASQCIATYLAWEHDKSLVMRRSDAKEGSPKIEGRYKTGQTCLVIQDQYLSGNATQAMIDDLVDEGIKVRDVIALVDLELDGKKKLKSRGYVPHSMISIRDVLQVLFDAGKLPGDIHKLSVDFLQRAHVK